MNPRRALWLLLLLAILPVRPVPAQTIVTLTTPTNGMHFGKAGGMALDIPLQARLTNPPTGSPIVRFYANGVLVASAYKQNSYSTIWSNVSFGTHQMLAGLDGAPPSSSLVTIQVDAAGVALISEQSIWHYLDGGASPAPDWFQPGADWSFWKSGLVQFGFGESDETTGVDFLNMADSTIYPAYYFHHAFAATNAAARSNLVVRLLRDDGAIVYLNGQELFRDNMPAGPVDYRTYASAGAVENTFDDHWINPALLLEGTNHIAVEIHNQGPHSEDISFDLRLVADLPVPPPRLTLTLAGTDLVIAWPRAYIGYRLEATAQLGGGSWSPVTNVFATLTEFRSTNTLTAPARFFRLSL